MEIEPETGVLDGDPVELTNIESLVLVSPHENESVTTVVTEEESLILPINSVTPDNVTTTQETSVTETMQLLSDETRISDILEEVQPVDPEPKQVESAQLDSIIEPIDKDSPAQLLMEVELAEPNQSAVPSSIDPKMDCDSLEAAETTYYWEYQLNTTEEKPCLAVTGKTEFQKGEYMRGCKWSPDGSCLLTNSDDSYMRIFNLPGSFYGIQDWKSFQENDENWNSALKIKEGGLVYDYCWYPLMSSMDPVSSCFLTTAANGPVHLWDAFTGTLRCTYRAYNQVDEVTPAYSIAFDSTGENIYCGFENAIRIFNIARPGRECVERKLKYPDFPSLNQTGIISCIAVSPCKPTLYACGSFRSTIGLYLEDGTVLCILEGHLGGLTHLKFSQDGTKLFSGGRKDSRLFCWDIRNVGDKYQIFNREVETNQRIYFDTTLNDKFLVSGATNGTVLIWDLQSNSEKLDDGCPTSKFQASSDCVNGVSINPFIPVLATASGQRHFPDLAEDSDDELFVESSSIRRKQYDVRLWKCL